VKIEMPTAENPVTIIHGDCLEVLPHIPAGVVDAVVTDPPYGIFACGGKWGRKAELQWDKRPAGNIVDLVTMAPHSIVWGGNYFGLPPSRGWLVWYKRDSVPSAADAELAWTSMDVNTRLIDWTIAATNAERIGHPAQKPLAVMQWSIQQLPVDAELILDPFAGSGTTAIAAILEGRRCILIEKDARYVEMCRQRVAKALCRDAGNLFREKEQGDLFAA
jgi:site-specific DNA-methyltransferase (adenine-specific)